MESREQKKRFRENFWGDHGHPGGHPQAALPVKKRGQFLPWGAEVERDALAVGECFVRRRQDGPAVEF